MVRESDRIILRDYDRILSEYAADLNINYVELDEEQQTKLLNTLYKQMQVHIKPFCKYVIGRYWTPIHDIWFRDYIKHPFNCVVAARGLGKSTFWTVDIPSWESWRNSAHKTTIMSYNEKRTFAFVKQTRDNYDVNDFLKNYIGREEWSSSMLKFKNFSFIEGISITSQVRSTHVHYIPADDLVNDEQKLSMDAIKHKIFKGIIPTVLKTMGKFCLIGTRFSENDIYEEFRVQATKFDNWNYSEISIDLDDEKKRVIFCYKDKFGNKHKWPMDNVYDYQRMYEYRELDPVGFDREYKCEIVSSSAQPYKWEDLIKCRDIDLTYEINSEAGAYYTMGLDSANSESKRADYMVLMCLKVLPNGKKYVVDYLHYTGMRVPNQLEEIKRFWKKYNKPHILVEGNSMGKSNIQMLEDNGLKGRVTQLWMDNKNKVDLTEYLQAEILLGNIIFPYKDADDVDKTKLIWAELASIKEMETAIAKKRTYGGSAKHDDLYVGLMLANKMAQLQGGRPTRIGMYSSKDFDNIVKFKNKRPAVYAGLRTEYQRGKTSSKGFAKKHNFVF